MGHTKKWDYKSKEWKDILDDEEWDLDLVSGGMHCSLCGATENTPGVKLGFYKDNKVSSAADPASKVECTNSAMCRVRREQKTGSGTSNSQGTMQFDKCRHEAKEAFHIDTISFYGGSEIKVEKQFFNPKDWLIVSLLGRKPTQKELLWSKDATWMKKLSVYARNMFVPDLVIDWPDMSPPPLTPGFWNELVALAIKAGKKKVLFFCIGGHGRTGTALASILVECCGQTPLEAVTFIRKVYCDNAVETKGQVEYLEALYETLPKEMKEEKSNGK